MEKLTDLQLDVLRVLWEQGEASAAEVTAALQPTRGLAPTTVATLLSRLEKRGAVDHRTEGRTYIYRARVAEDAVQRTLVARLKDAFAGDITALIAQLIRDDEIDARDLARARALIEQRQRELKENA